MNQPDAGIEILKPGTFTSEDGRVFTFTDADIAELAESYDPQMQQAAFVVGHPKTDSPAYGWTAKLTNKDSILVAQPSQVDPAFADMVNAGRFNRVSASIFLRDSPGNPKPGKLYIKHVGFLGAAPPAVKGLRPASLADNADDGAVCFAMPLSGLGWTLTDLMQRLRDYFIDKDGLEAADKVIPQWQIRSIQDHTADKVQSDATAVAAYAAPKTNVPEISMQQQQQQQQQTNDAANLAAQQKALDEKDADLARRQNDLDDREAKARREDAASFAEGLVADGKLLPRQQAGVVELLLALPANAPLNFAEGGAQVSKPASDVLRSLLNDLPKQINYAEKSRDEGGDVAAASFAAPAGVVVDAAGADLYNKAKAYQAQNPNASWLGAVAAVGG